MALESSPLEQNSLWGAIIRSKYGVQANGWYSSIVERESYRNPWKAISKNLDSFKTFIRLKVGKGGDRIRFWEDSWISDAPLSSLFPRLQIVSCNRNFLISSLASWTSSNQLLWNLSFQRLFNNMEVEDFSNLMALVSDAPISNIISNRRAWVGDKLGFFSCKSFFELLIDSPGENSFVPHKLIWKEGIPPKVQYLHGWPCGKE